MNSGVKYSLCNIARSALSSFSLNGDKIIGKNEEVIRFMKGLLQKVVVTLTAKSLPVKVDNVTWSLFRQKGSEPPCT